MSAPAFVASMPTGLLDDPRSFFHPTWYLSRYPEVRKSGLDAWSHYTTVGERSGFQPHPFFEPDWYRQCAGIQEGLLYHYAKHGRIRALSPHPLLHPVNEAEDINELSRREPASPTPYLSLVPNSDTSHPRLLKYLLSSDADWRFPNPWFDRLWYRQRYESDTARYGDPLSHYVGSGGFRGNATGRYWDWKNYLNRNPDVLMSGMTPLEHYLRQGHSEFRRAATTPLFSMIKFAATDGDLELVLNLLQHHLGWKSKSIRLLRIDFESDLTPLAHAVIHRLSNALLIEQSDRVALIGNPDVLHEIDSHVVVGPLVIIPSDALSKRLGPCLVAPSPSDKYSAETLLASFCRWLDWETPIVCVRQIAALLQDLTGIKRDATTILEDDHVVETTCLMLHKWTLVNGIDELTKRCRAHSIAIDLNELLKPLPPQYRTLINTRRPNMCEK